jgi:hypothetical protein
MYIIQHCFICRPSDSTVSEDRTQNCCNFGIDSVTGTWVPTLCCSVLDKAGEHQRQRCCGRQASRRPRPHLDHHPLLPGSGDHCACARLLYYSLAQCGKWDGHRVHRNGGWLISCACASYCAILLRNFGKWAGHGAHREGGWLISCACASYRAIFCAM